jgi:AcrR family transcriptional regulator
MVSRERILEAAARVYAKHGFKGATTRAIAIEADVNEVTLFRTFGSKSALLEAVLNRQISDQPDYGLPEEPKNPHEELKAFIQESLDCIREIRPLLIHTMGEMEERAEAREFACQGRQHTHTIMTTYIRQLQRIGLADPDVNVDSAAVMLLGTVMSDVMGRPIVPDVYPPMNDAAEQYTKLFLRAIGVREILVAPEETPAVETNSVPNSVGPSSRSSHTSQSNRS